MIGYEHMLVKPKGNEEEEFLDTQKIAQYK